MSYMESMEQSVELGVQTVGGDAGLGVPRTAPVSECPLCGHEDGFVLFSAPDRLHGTPGQFTYRKCPSCLTVYQDPRVIAEDLGLCYPSEYYTHTNPSISSPDQGVAFADDPPLSSRRWSGIRDSLRLVIVDAVKGKPLQGLEGFCGKVLALSRNLRERAFYNQVEDILLPRAIGLRALDVGCGNGRLMKKLESTGYEVEGVEFDPSAAEMARRLTGRCIWDGDFRKINLPLGSYDLIVLHHVIEHLEDPLEGLRRIKELLVPGGRVALFYPNPQSLGARVFRSSWYPWEVPRHLVLPCGRALAKKASCIGLVPIRIYTSARESTEFFAMSRAYLKNKPIRTGECQIARIDRLMGFLARALVKIGFFVGEEVVILLKGDHPHR
jgi:SAM-dependent methyltransferase